MKKNVGNLDRILRVVVGLGVLSLTVIGPKTLWGLVGIIPIAVAGIGFCPLYTIVGISTCPMKKEEK